MKTIAKSIVDNFVNFDNFERSDNFRKMNMIMKKILRYTVMVVLMAGIVACTKDDDTAAVTPVEKAEVTTLNVDVVLPASVREDWQLTIDMAQKNIALAQQKLKKQVKLNLRYHDEDTEDLDVLAYNLTHPKAGDDTCHAIIGPYHSGNAMTFLKYAWQQRLPVVMPSCTSAELQRINARETYAWFLTDSDITQCEIMLAAAKTVGYKETVLVYSDDNYGKSFFDWFPYYAQEQGVKLSATVAYKKGMDLNATLKQVASQSHETQLLLCAALSDASLYLDVCDQAAAIFELNADGMYAMYTPFCADTSFDDEIIGGNERAWNFHMGITPYCSPSYGFPQVLQGTRFSKPSVGEAQMYDALTIIALGAAHQVANGDRCIVNGEQVAYNEKPFGPGLTDHMRAVVCNRTATPTSWDGASLAVAFNYLSLGLDIDVTGASGSLIFDLETSTKVLNSTYMIWEMRFEDRSDIGGGLVSSVDPIVYLSTSGSNTESSTTALWEQQKRYMQTFDDTPVSTTLPAVTDHWAVVISPSTSWANYRHQADAFAMYQTLRRHGYDDDHIVLIVEDNLADDSRNAFPGKIYVERSSNPNETDPLVNDDVRQGAVVDYHFSQLSRDDLADIMLGRQSDRLPQVIHSTATSDVFFFWSGHGGSGEGPLWGNEDARGFGTSRIKDIVNQMAGNYRRMMFSIETCFSGLWGEALKGAPNVLVMTAATGYETSKADVHDNELGTFLSNAFARTFRRQVNANNAVAIYDIYRELFRTTTGSHVSIYNQEHYGSVYTETMRDFFPR